MKRFLCLVLSALMLLMLTACSHTNAESGKKVTLTYIYGEKNISIELPEEEAEKVIEILDGNQYDPTSATPSCGFSKDISLKVGTRTYAIACDTCKIIQDRGNLKYFSVTEEEIDYIHALFEKYGGHFPCI